MWRHLRRERGINAMALIHVPRPPKNAGDSERSLSSLLKSQMEHLFEAEKRLPHRYRSQIYINAIKTEGEAAEYIRKVTEAIHRAHEDAAALRAKKALRHTSGSIAIAAVADESAVEKQGADSKKSAGDATQKQS
jgi:hypothetical protein